MAQWLAIDWDHDQLHLIAAQASRRGAQVERAFSWALPEPLTPASAERVGKALRDLLKGLRVTAGAAVVSIGRDRVILKEARFPAVPKSEEANLVRFQVAKELTEPIDTSAVDYAHLLPPGQPGDRHVLAVVVKRDVVAAVQGLCRAAGLKLVGLAPRAFGVGPALQRALGPDRDPLRPDAVTAILRLGTNTGELNLYRGDRLSLSRSIPQGPALLADVKRTLAVYAAQNDTDPPAPLYFLGARDALPADAPLAIEAVDPLAPDAGAEVDRSPRGVFAGPVGLLQRWAATRELPVNLAAPKRVQVAANPRRERRVLIGGLATLVLILLVGGFSIALSRKRAEITALNLQKNSLDEQLAKLAQDRADIEALKEWEQTSVAWLDELYDFTARFPYQNGVHLNQLSANIVAKKGKDGFAGKIDVTGVAPGTKGVLVHQLRDAISRDPHVRAAMGPVKGVGSDSAPLDFNLKMEVAKQPPAKYTTRLVVPTGPPPTDEMMAEDDDAAGEDDMTEGGNR